ncbi:MAG: hypothetical protein IJQ66_02630, partial [Clostridia bacterium]|nr:hypothetical protein [Clostridia bacterium]
YGEETEGLYASDEEFLAEITELSSEDGWSAYWSIEDNKWYFSDKKIYVIKTTVSDDTEILINRATVAEDNKYTVILPAQVDVTEIESVSDGSITIPIISADAENNSVTFDLTQIQSGEKELIFESENCVYKFANSLIVDMIITTVEEFNAFGEIVKADETTINSYYILGADINYGGEYWSAGCNGHNTKFRGTLDGKGYSIKNFKAQRGLFGDMIEGSVVKNMYLDVKLDGDWQGGAVCWWNYGRIENCAIVLNITKGDGTYFGGVVHSNYAAGIISNCIVNIESYTGNDKGRKFNAISDSGSGIPTNCYAVSPYSSAMYGSVATGLYANEETFLAEITVLPVENGWSGYWSIEDEVLYFGGTVVLGQS